MKRYVLLIAVLSAGLLTAAVWANAGDEATAEGQDSAGCAHKDKALCDKDASACTNALDKAASPIKKKACCPAKEAEAAAPAETAPTEQALEADKAE